MRRSAAAGIYPAFLEKINSIGLHGVKQIVTQDEALIVALLLLLHATDFFQILNRFKLKKQASSNGLLARRWLTIAPQVLPCCETPYDKKLSRRICNRPMDSYF